MKLKVTDISNKAVGEVEIDDAVFADIFGRTVRKDILARAVNWQLAKRRAGKHKDGKLVVWGETKANGKTKDLAAQLKKLGWGSVLVIDGPEVNEQFAKAARNIPNVDVLPQQGANVYDILRRDTLVLTKGAMEHL